MTGEIIGKRRLPQVTRLETRQRELAQTGMACGAGYGVAPVIRTS
jgi:hypothetical protein